MAELPKDEPMVSSVFFQQWTPGCLLEEKRSFPDKWMTAQVLN
jgi:hypothetical protein